MGPRGGVGGHKGGGSHGGRVAEPPGLGSGRRPAALGSSHWCAAPSLSWFCQIEGGEAPIRGGPCTPQPWGVIGGGSQLPSCPQSMLSGHGGTLCVQPQRETPPKGLSSAPHRFAPSVMWGGGQRDPASPPPIVPLIHCCEANREGLGSSCQPTGRTMEMWGAVGAGGQQEPPGAMGCGPPPHQGPTGGRGG